MALGPPHLIAAEPGRGGAVLPSVLMLPGAQGRAIGGVGPLELDARLAKLREGPAVLSPGRPGRPRAEGRGPRRSSRPVLLWLCGAFP